MPCIIRRVPLFEGYVPEPIEPYTADDLGQAAQFEPENGVYAAFATWNGLRVTKLSAHLDRLEDSAAKAGFSLRIDRELLKRQIRELIIRSGFGESRVRLSATPDDPWITVSLEPFDGPPVQLRESGVRCTTIVHGARSIPEAKRTSWLRSRPGTISNTDEPAIIFERLLVDSSGNILEGTRSNFFGIAGGGTIMTAGSGVLAGIARSIVIEVASRVALEPVQVEQLPSLSEAFITSSSRGVVPVIEIDGISVGNGRPGNVTGGLIRLYDKRAIELEEPL